MVFCPLLTPSKKESLDARNNTFSLSYLSRQKVDKCYLIKVKE